MKLSPFDLQRPQRQSDAAGRRTAIVRMACGVLVAPLIAAAPILILVAPSNLLLGLASYGAALVLAVLAYAALSAFGWLPLSAYLAAGAVVALLQMALMPMLNALVSAGRWRAPQLPLDAPIAFLFLLVLTGAAAGGLIWWVTEPRKWPTVDELIDHDDGD